MQVTIYIRKENEPTWEGLTDKSVWVNKQLEQQKGSDKHLELAEVKVEEKPHKKWETDQDIIDDVLEVFPGAIVEKPEFMCCTSKRTRCNHWQWDLDKALWINSISGRAVEG